MEVDRELIVRRAEALLAEVKFGLIPMVVSGAKTGAFVASCATIVLIQAAISLSEEER